MFIVMGHGLVSGIPGGRTYLTQHLLDRGFIHININNIFYLIYIIIITNVRTYYNRALLLVHVSKQFG